MMEIQQQRETGNSSADEVTATNLTHIHIVSLHASQACRIPTANGHSSRSQSHDAIEEHTIVQFSRIRDIKS